MWFSDKLNLNIVIILGKNVDYLYIMKKVEMADKKEKKNEERRGKMYMK